MSDSPQTPSSVPTPVPAPVPRWRKIALAAVVFLNACSSEAHWSWRFTKTWLFRTTCECCSAWAKVIFGIFLGLIPTVAACAYIGAWWFIIFYFLAWAFFLGIRWFDATPLSSVDADGELK